MVVNGLFELQTLRINFHLLSSFEKKRSLPSHHIKVLYVLMLIASISYIMLFIRLGNESSSHVSHRPYLQYPHRCHNDVLEAKKLYKL